MPPAPNIANARRDKPRRAAAKQRGLHLVMQNRQVFNLQRQNIDGGSMLVKAIYENSVLRPLERLDLKDGDLVEIEVKKNPVDQLYGIIKVRNKQWLDEIIESPDLEPI
jgi:predicted DNA-binding antitoxin AbrB/MazE fold protein